MGLYLRQVALVAAELEPVVEGLKSVFGLGVCFVDPEVAEFGLENSLLAVGANFIEVVAPIQAGTAAGRYLERRGGDGGYMVITQVIDAREQAACRERAAALGVRVAWEKPHTHGHFMQLHPRDTGGCFLEIDATSNQDPLGPWPPAGNVPPNTESRDCLAEEIVAVELQSNAPETLARRWAGIIDEPIARDDKNRFVIALRNADIRFREIRDQRGDGLAEVDVRVGNAETVLRRARDHGARTNGSSVAIGGVTFNLKS